jgi:hypothetical protein
MHSTRERLGPRVIIDFLDPGDREWRGEVGSIKDCLLAPGAAEESSPYPAGRA